MIRRKRLALALSGALALLLILVSVAAVVISKVADIPQLREPVVALLSQYVRGTVGVHALRVSLLPLPHVVLDGVSLAMPGTAEATIASVSVYPELLPLLRGRLQPARIRIVAPDVRVDLPASPGADAAGAASPSQLSEGLAAMLAGGTPASAPQAPGLTVVVQGGQVRLVTARSAAVLFTDVGARLHLRPQQADFDLTCASSSLSDLAARSDPTPVLSSSKKGSAPAEQTRAAGLSERIAVRAAVEPTHVNVDADVMNVDVATVRAAASAVAGQVPAVRQLFAILQSGHVSHLTLHSEAGALADIAGREALVIRGTLADGHVQVPGVDLDLQDVGGDALVTGGILTGEHLAARLGRSRAHDGALRLGLSGAAPELHVETTVEADAADLSPLLKRLAGGTLATALDRVSDAQGVITGKLTLSGTTADVAVAADTSQMQLSARVPGVKEPLHIAGGHVSYTARRIAASDVTVTAGGSKLSQLSVSVDWANTPAALSATVTEARIVVGEVYPWLTASGWLGNASWAPQALAGTLVLSAVQLNGPATAPAQWRFECAGAGRDLEVDSPALRQWIKLRSGVSVAGARVVRDATGRLTFSGTFSAPGDMDGVVDLLWDGAAFQITRLSVQDAQSKATISLLLKGGALELAFDGSLERATLDRLVPNNPFPAHWVRGKFRTRIPVDEPGRLTADGQLEAGDVLLPARGSAPLRAETLALEANGGAFAVRATLVTSTQSRLHVAGTVRPSPQAVVADLDVSAGDLDWAAVESFLSPATEARGGVASELGPPLRGTLRVAADSFTYSRFTWKPLQATVVLAAGATTVTVTGADLCGIATPGKITVVPGGLDVAFQPRAQHALEQTLACLDAEKGLVTGQYTLTGSLTGHGPLAGIVKSLQGEVAFESTHGRIYRAQTAKTLLSVLSIATGSVLNITDVATKGLEYERMALKGVLHEGTLQLSEVVLNAPSATMVGEGSIDVIGQTSDLTLLVAPLKTLDTVVSYIPLVGDVFGGTLVSIPVKISGPLNAPEVRPGSVTAIGDRLLGIMKRTVKLPITILQPLFPEQK